jgi:ABC-type Fe3+-siderophore transport system permease subunit
MSVLGLKMSNPIQKFEKSNLNFQTIFAWFFGISSGYYLGVVLIIPIFFIGLVFFTLKKTTSKDKHFIFYVVSIFLGHTFWIVFNVIANLWLTTKTVPISVLEWYEYAINIALVAVLVFFLYVRPNKYILYFIAIYTSYYTAMNLYSLSALDAHSQVYKVLITHIALRLATLYAVWVALGHLREKDSRVSQLSA